MTDLPSSKVGKIVGGVLDSLTGLAILDLCAYFSTKRATKWYENGGVIQQFQIG
jgi:hypothetical protein